MANYARNHVCFLFSARVHLLDPMPSVASHRHHAPLLCKIIRNQKRNSQPDDINLLFQGARQRASTCTILNGCHIINANWKCNIIF